MHPHGPLVLSAAAKQVAQCEMKLRGVGVVLHRFNEGVNRLVLLFVQQEIQTLEVGFGSLPVFNAHLAQIQPGRQPPQCENNRKTQQNPGEIKFHGVLWCSSLEPCFCLARLKTTGQDV